MSILLEDHRRRVARLLRGERRIDDLQCLFSDLRMVKPGRDSVREVGHFAAHREERQSGISLERANHMLTSARLWQKQSDGAGLDIDRLQEAGRVNLAIMPDERVQGRFGISRQTAEQTFKKALRKFASRKPLKAREGDVLSTFGLSMMWQYLFDDRRLMADVTDLLVQEGALSASESPSFGEVFDFITLYALSIMHGSRLRTPEGDVARLRLAKSTETGHLRIKVELPVSETPKPIMSSVTLFETSLDANAYCDPRILTTLEEPIPIDIEDNRLVALA